MRIHNFIYLILSIYLLSSSQAFSHESRPAYLEVTESQANVFDITWRRPARGEMVLSMQPVFPEHCLTQGGVANYFSQGAHVQRWALHCESAGLVGHSIYIEGLVQTITDVLVRIQFLDSTIQTQILKPNDTRMTVQGAPSLWQVTSDYFVLGVEHILGGIDHLLFVLCLLLIVQGKWLLI